MDLGPKAEMREIRTSGLMSGIWKRNGLIVTAPDLDSTDIGAGIWQRHFGHVGFVHGHVGQSGSHRVGARLFYHRGREVETDDASRRTGQQRSDAKVSSRTAPEVQHGFTWVDWAEAERVAHRGCRLPDARGEAFQPVLVIAEVTAFSLPLPQPKSFSGCKAKSFSIARICSKKSTLLLSHSALML